MFTCPLWECQPDNSEIWFRLSWNWELNSETLFNSVCVLKNVSFPVFVFNGCRYVVVIGCDAMEFLLSIWYSFDLVTSTGVLSVQDLPQ